MTDTNERHGDTPPAAPALPGIDRTAVPGGPASVGIPTMDGGRGGHPGIVIRPGPTGPRAALGDGPDVWEVIGALHALRGEDPTRHGEALLGELCTVTGLTAAQVSAALDYYTAHPGEIDTRISANHDAAQQAMRSSTAVTAPRGDAT